MNHITIAGRLGNDPEARFTSSGQKVTTFRVASNSKKSGKDETIWWRITVWGEQFDKMISYLKKGSAVIVHGDLAKPEIYQSRDGSSQVSLNVTASSLSFSPFGKPAGEEDGGSSQQQKPFTQSNSFQAPNQGMGEPATASTFSDEEIPF